VDEGEKHSERRPFEESGLADDVRHRLSEDLIVGRVGRGGRAHQPRLPRLAFVDEVLRTATMNVCRATSGDLSCAERMEPLWSVMKKGLLAGDTLR
jgi:hypothetical protein